MIVSVLRRFSRSGLLPLIVLGIVVYLGWLGTRLYECNSVHWARFTGDGMYQLGHSFPQEVQDDNSSFQYWMSHFEEAELVYNFRVDRLEAFCDKIEYLGKDDGEKVICHSGPYVLSSPCLVYSFGVAQDFTFDEDIVRRYGCQVDSFDPSTGLESHRRTSQIRFFNFGLASRNIDGFRAPKTIYSHSSHTWKMRTLAWIISNLKHVNRIIDVLKLDIEGWEFPALTAALKTGVLDQVKQIVVEFHVFGEERKKYIDKLRLLTRLFNYGFRIVYRHNHNCPDSCDPVCKSTYCHQADITFVNSRFQFPSKN